VHFFFEAERHLPPDHHDSNFQMATEALFSEGVVKTEPITRIKGEYADTEKAALEYEQALRAYFQWKDGEYPRFDLVLLGMGDEGHCLSLFPGTKALHASRRIVVRHWGRPAAVYGARHTDGGSRQPGESRDLFGYPLGQGSGLKGGSGRSLRAGATPGSIDPTGQRKPPLAGGPGRRLDAGNRNSQLTRRNTWQRLLSVQSNNT
jgi:hypothetical protein